MMTFQAILTFLGFLGLVMGGADVQSSSSAHQDAPIPAATLSTFKTVTTGAIHGRQFSLPYFTPTIPGEPGFTTSTSSFLVSESPSTIETDTPATTRAFTDPHISLPYFTPTNLPVATRVQERGVPPTPSGMGVTWCKTQNTFSQFGPEHCAMGVVRRKGDQMKGDLHSAYIWDASCKLTSTFYLPRFCLLNTGYPFSHIPPPPPCNPW